MEPESGRAALAAEFPQWRIGRRQNLWNAWLPGTRPPLVLRDATLDGLRKRLAETARGISVNEPDREELASLGAEFPGWRIGSIARTADTGPEQTNLTATSPDGVLLTAPNAAMLRQKIRYEESQQ
jgi:hypothetical protein